VIETQIVLAAGLLLLAGVAATAIAVRLEVPAFALCMAAGMAIGSDGAGWVQFDDYQVAGRIGSVCLALILFEAAWTTDLADMWGIWGTATRLAVPGTILTALVCAAGMLAILHRPPMEALLVAAAVASTDGAAVFALLRRSRLRPRIARTLEAEAGLNDPVAIFLLISAVTWAQHRTVYLPSLVVLFGKDLLLGLAVGLAVGVVGTLVFRARWLPATGLYAVSSVSLAALAFGAAQALQGSGFLAVYVAGLVLGNDARRSHQATTVFQRALASLADVSLFLTLGLVVSPAELGEAAREGVAVCLLLALAARPLAVFILTRDRFSTPEKVVLSWAGLRGAVPVILATIPITEGVPGSRMVFDVVFVAVIASALLQGATIGPLARMLGLVVTRPTLGAALAEAEASRARVMEAAYTVPAGSDAIGRTIGDLHLPTGVAVARIMQAGGPLRPSNATRIRVGDVLHLLAPTEAAEVLEAHLASWMETSALPAVDRWTVRRPPPLGPALGRFVARERAWWNALGGQVARLGRRPVRARPARQRWP
jgi:cell volume regulation protein A